MTSTAKIADLAPRPTGPLSGIRILDLTSVVNGAYGTQMLADQGADVIKLEDPGTDEAGGDIMRWAGRVPEKAPAGMGPIFLGINRNKRSIALDIKLPANRAVVERLIASCDVLASSIRYDAMERLGLDYEAVRAIRPDIVYVHAAGYGSDGPARGEPAYDDLIQTASGFADILSRTDGNPEPRIVPTLIADKVSGLFFAQAVSAALVCRARTGQGQFVEVPMFECVTSFLLVEHLYNQTFVPPTGQWGYERVINPNRRPYRTKDGYVSILPYTDRHWERFFAASGADQATARDPRFSNHAARVRHAQHLYGIVEALALTRTTDEWLALLKPLSIPAVRFNRLEDLPDNPHLEASGFFRTYDHPDLGLYRQVKPPVTFAKTPATIHRHPPALGEHTQEIIAELANPA